MKIAIISDTHDNLKNLEKFINWIKAYSPKIIIHCGDVTTPKTLQEILENFEGDFFLSLGNADIYLGDFQKLEKKYQNFRFFEEIGEIKIDKLKIAFCHLPKTAKKVAYTNKYHFIFYGHTHKPWAEKINESYLLNPGNLKGEPFLPTFCVLDLERKKFELVMLESEKSR